MRKILFLFCMILSITSFAVPVTWTNTTGVSVSGNSLSGLVSNSWSAGAFSVESIAANTNGYFEMTAQETNAYRMGGLSSTNLNASYTSIQYAVYLHAGAGLYIYESGAYIDYFGTYATGDIFRVSREGNQIKYYQNGSLFYTSATLTTATLYADTSLYTYGSTIYNAHIVQIPEPASFFLFLCFFALAGKFFIQRPW